MLTPLQSTYNTIVGDATNIFMIVAVLVAIVAFFILISRMRGVTAFFFAIVVLFGIRAVGINHGTSQGEVGVTTAWEQARVDQATFVETLHAPFAAYDFDKKTCQQTVNYPTNCRYYTRDPYYNPHPVCTTDSDGEEDCDTEYDTRYTPYFAYEVRYWAAADIMPRLAEAPLQVVDGYPMPRVYLSDWLAPEDWGDRSFSLGSIPLFHEAIESQPPADWLRIRDAINRGGPLVVGNFPHHYLNYFHADDQNLFRLYDGRIPQYQSLNLLPTMNRIYGSYDYDFVQFNDVTPLTGEKEWQQYASQWAANAGPKLQASLILYFVPASKVANRLEFISTGKAYLMQKNVFGTRILPKNLVLIGCGVSDDNTAIEWCEMETGMYTGNTLVKEDVAKVQQMPFKPANIFGTIESFYGPAGADGLHEANLSFGGGGVLSLLYRPEPDGFARVRMGPNDYLMTNIQPTPQQIDAIIGSARTSSILFAFLSGVLAIVGSIFVSYMISTRN